MMVTISPPKHCREGLKRAAVTQVIELNASHQQLMTGYCGCRTWSPWLDSVTPSSACLHVTVRCSYRSPAEVVCMQFGGITVGFNRSSKQWKLLLVLDSDGAMVLATSRWRRIMGCHSSKPQ